MRERGKRGKKRKDLFFTINQRYRIDSDYRIKGVLRCILSCFIGKGTERR
jgi:hypothetical protein